MGLILVALVAAAIAFVLLQRSTRQKTGAALPPGPKPVPVLGNIFNLTASELWLTATKWAQSYGDVSYVHVVGQGLLFLSSPQAATDLLERRGAIYSDKPELVMAGELCGCEKMVAFTPYGERSKAQRRLISQAFGPQAIPNYHPMIYSSTSHFLAELLKNPSDYLRCIRVYAGSLTLSTVYGYEVTGRDDKFLTLAEECVDILSNEVASGGGIWPVDIIPAMKNMPEWMPGSGFLAKARFWKSKMYEFTDKPYDYLVSSVKSGTYHPSFCSTILDGTKEMDVDNDLLKWTANSMYSASMDTTIATIAHLFLALMEHPEVIEKARKELDDVVGTDRLPEFSDRASLPYVEAVLNEIWRWSAPVPMGLPHRLSEDDHYKGMLIPKGTLVFANIWAMSRDASVFPEPDAFNPERFVGVDMHSDKGKSMDPRQYIFGYGRRICPGADLVESSIWILVASILASIDVKAPSSGMPSVKYDNSIFRLPTKFECDIQPRSQHALKLIKESLDE